MLCTICAKHPATHGLKPFCSPRCKDIDLNRWFTGSYAVPIVEDEDEDGEEFAQPASSGEEH